MPIFFGMIAFLDLQLTLKGGKMKNRLMRSISTMFLVIAMVLPVTALAQPKGSQPPASPAQPKSGQRVRPGGGERHPEIRAAIRALERAKEHLQRAAHDFGGHRVAALESVDRALEQLKLALQYDKD